MLGLRSGETLTSSEYRVDDIKITFDLPKAQCSCEDLPAESAEVSIDWRKASVAFPTRVTTIGNIPITIILTECHCVHARSH